MIKPCPQYRRWLTPVLSGTEHDDSITRFRAISTPPCDDGTESEEPKSDYYDDSVPAESKKRTHTGL